MVFKATDNSGLVTQAELTLEVNAIDVATDTAYSYVATSYDGVGNVTGIADSVMGTWSYNYDTLNRLAGANATAGDFDSQAICWQYLPSGIARRAGYLARREGVCVSVVSATRTSSATKPASSGLEHRSNQARIRSARLVST